MPNTMLNYAVRDLTKRKKAAFSVFVVMTVCLFVTFSFSMIGYSSHRANLDSYTQAFIQGLNRAEAEETAGLDYVKEAVILRQSDGFYTVQVKFHDGNPFRLEEKCARVLRDVGYAVKNGGAGYHVNEQYYNESSTPYVLQNFPTLLIFYLLGGASVCLALRIKNSRMAGEFGYMRAMGIKKSRIIGAVSAQTGVVYVIAAAVALGLAYPLNMLICYLTEKLYVGSYTRLTFAVSWGEIAWVFVLFAGICAVFQILHLRMLLRREILVLMNNSGDCQPAYTPKSSRLMDEGDKITAYSRIYSRRMIKASLGKVIKSVTLFALPVFLLTMSVSFNQSRAFDDPRDFVIAKIRNDITSAMVEEIQSLPSVMEADYEIHPDGTYGNITIYSHSGVEEQCSASLEHITNKYSLQLTDIYHMKLTLVSQANIFAPYYLLHAVLMFVCELLIIGADLVYELHTRKREFAVMRAVGYSSEEIARLTEFYRKSGVAAYVLAVAGTFLLINIFFGVWVNKVMLYPIVIVISFGILNYTVYRILCERFMVKFAQEETSALLYDNT